MSKPSVVQPLHQAEPERRLRRVFVRDLVLSCLIGVHRHEHDGRQRVRINVDLKVAEADGAIDDKLSNVLCYETVVDRVREIATAGHISLVETLAERVADACLSDRRVHSVTVRVEKLDIFADAVSVGVEIERGNATH